jgi:hypothetical protein
MHIVAKCFLKITTSAIGLNHVLIKVHVEMGRHFVDFYAKKKKA